MRHLATTKVENRGHSSDLVLYTALCRLCCSPGILVKPTFCSTCTCRQNGDEFTRLPQNCVVQGIHRRTHGSGTTPGHLGLAVHFGMIGPDV
jgi:hypothetical protein